MKAMLLAAALAATGPAAPWLASPAQAVVTLSEGFETVVPAGWTANNQSVPLGETGWFQGNTLVFTAQAGPDNSYAGANYNNISGAGTISNWLITPTLTFNNGDVLSFYTRSAGGGFADRLQVWFNPSGGTTITDFTVLLLDINPTLASAGYPIDWTEFQATITGLPGATNGSIGFRYFVTDGGPLGTNGDYIGIDTVTVVSPVPEPASMGLFGLSLAGLALARRRRRG